MRLALVIACLLAAVLASGCVAVQGPVEDCTCGTTPCPP